MTCCVLAFEVKGFLSCRNKACASYRILIIGTRVRHGAPHITNQKNAYGQNYVSNQPQGCDSVRGLWDSRAQDVWVLHGACRIGRAAA